MFLFLFFVEIKDEINLRFTIHPNLRLHPNLRWTILLKSPTYLYFCEIGSRSKVRPGLSEMHFCKKTKTKTKTKLCIRI